MQRYAVVVRQRTVVRRIAASVNSLVVGTPVVLKPGSIASRPEELSAALTGFVAGRAPHAKPVA